MSLYIYHSASSSGLIHPPNTSSTTEKSSTNHGLNDRELGEKSNVQDPKVRAKFHKLEINTSQQLRLRVISKLWNVFLNSTPHLISQVHANSYCLFHSFSFLGLPSWGPGNQWNPSLGLFPKCTQPSTHGAYLSENVLKSALVGSPFILHVWGCCCLCTSLFPITFKNKFIEILNYLNRYWVCTKFVEDCM